MLAVVATLASIRRYSAPALVAWACAFCFATVWSNLVLYGPQAKPGDWERVARYLAASEKPDQPILAFQSENALSLSVYYTGVNKIVAVPAPIDFNDVSSSAVILHDAQQLDALLDRLPGSARSIWVVTSPECQEENVDYRCDIFERVMAQRFSTASRRDFFRSTVRLLQRKGRPAALSRPAHRGG
jgi:hypothetical protein